MLKLCLNKHPRSCSASFPPSTIVWRKTVAMLSWFWSVFNLIWKQVRKCRPFYWFNEKQQIRVRPAWRRWGARRARGGTRLHARRGETRSPRGGWRRWSAGGWAGLSWSSSSSSSSSSSTRLIYLAPRPPILFSFSSLPTCKMSRNLRTVLFWSEFAGGGGENGNGPQIQYGNLLEVCPCLSPLVSQPLNVLFSAKSPRSQESCLLPRNFYVLWQQQ